MRPTRATLFLTLPLLALGDPGPPLAVAQSSGLPTVTLREAIDRALQVQPAMVQSRGAVTNATWQQRAAYGSFLPSVSVGSSAFRVNTPSVANGLPVVSKSYQYNSSVSLSLDLFDGFHRLARTSSAKATAQAAGAGLVNQQFQVTLQTQQAFFTALADEELVRVSEAQLRRAEEQLTITRNRFLAGAATRSDTLTSTVQVGTARLALLQGEASLATAQADLARQIGFEGPVRAVADSNLAAPIDTLGLRATALSAAPLVRQAEAEARAAAASVWDARSSYWPFLNLSYSASSQGLTPPWQGFDDENRNLSQLRFGLSWTIFNGFSREQNVAQSIVSRDVARAQSADARRQVSAELTQQIASMNTANSQIGIAGTNVEAAAEAVRVQQDRYRLGSGTLLDLLTAQADLTQAEVSQVQARYNYLIARAQVEAIVGRVL